MKLLSFGIEYDYLRRACYYTNRHRLNATLFHDGDDFFMAVGGSGKAEFVILAAGKDEVVGKGRERGSDGTELPGKRHFRQADGAPQAGHLSDMPEVGQDSVADVDHGRDLSRFGQGDTGSRARRRVQQAGDEIFIPPSLTGGG